MGLFIIGLTSIRGRRPDGGKLAFDSSIEQDDPVTALEHLQTIYRNPNEATSTRIRAAVEALPFEVPKLTAVAQLHEGDTFAARLEKAITRSNGARLIEAKAIEVPDDPRRE